MMSRWRLLLLVMMMMVMVTTKIIRPRLGEGTGPPVAMGTDLMPSASMRPEPASFCCSTLRTYATSTASVSVSRPAAYPAAT
jgi:hypothetical protein